MKNFYYGHIYAEMSCLTCNYFSSSPDIANVYHINIKNINIKKTKQSSH